MSVEDFAREVRRALDAIDDGDFEAKRALVVRLGVQVRLAVEDGQWVVYASSPVLGRSESLPIATDTTNHTVC